MIHEQQGWELNAVKLWIKFKKVLNISLLVIRFGFEDKLRQVSFELLKVSLLVIKV